MKPPTSLPFEKPLIELEELLSNLQDKSEEQNLDLVQEVERLKKKISQTRGQIYKNLTPWQRVLIVRHKDRPYLLDYLRMITSDFVELHGDRIHGDDKALIGGFATIDGEKVMVIGQQKGRDTKENILRNFGCAHPEGYRKALRLMKLATHFNLPIITFIDTPGAFPGVPSEERHVAEAIAVNIREMFSLTVPVIAIVIGEGGSGGALGIGVADRILILENAYYSVISPEGCASILWKDRAYAPQAAEALKMIAKDLLELKLVDEIIPEPEGGAHRDPSETAQTLKTALLRNLKELKEIPAKKLVESRFEKYRHIGHFTE